MGTFSVDIEVGDSQGNRYEIVRALVDTGATYTPLPTGLLRRLDVGPTGTRAFVMADERRVHIDVGITWLRFEGEAYPNLVVFGPDDAQPLLGAVTLETFGLAVDPVSQRLIHVDALMK